VEHVGLSSGTGREDGGPLAGGDLFLGSEYGWRVVDSKISLLHRPWNFELCLGDDPGSGGEYGATNCLENTRHIQRKTMSLQKAT